MHWARFGKGCVSCLDGGHRRVNGTTGALVICQNVMTVVRRSFYLIGPLGPTSLYRRP